MLTIARLKIRGWKCYREETVLDLEPKAYAVFARKDGNPDASNFGGKSSLLEAVDFALFGRLSDEFKNKKRGWISRGEAKGEVDLTLSDGSRIQRSQSRTGSERLWYYPPGDPTRGATQDEAQKRIVELLGLSKTDFPATRYFPQGKMAELITLDPGPRLDLVAGWLRLKPLQDCEDEAADVLRAIVKRRDEARAAASAAEQMEAAAYERAGLADAFALGSGAEDLGKATEAAAHDEHQARALLDLARAGLDADRERAASRSAAEAYERTVASGVSLRSEVAALAGVAQETAPGPRWDLAVSDARARMVEDLREADEALAAAGGARGRAEAEERGKRQVATGRFDGACPLVGAPCPARAFVEGEGTRMRGAADAARAALQRAGQAYDGAARAQGEAATRLSLLDAKVRRLGELRAEAGRLKPAHERWQALSDGAAGVDSRSAWDSAEAACRGAGERLAALRAAREAVEDARRRRDAARGEAERLERAVRAAQAAVAIFNAAQRRMAEDSLAEIEEQANASLAACEIPLSVEVRWSREGSGPAKTCAACGEPFPRSERVKACERCGAPRGQHVINGLTIEPSARSGGALDLGGIFLKFAAGGWLVADREAQWGCAMMDEPLATLDQYHRRAVASHLPAVLRDNGIEQAIILGHDRAALDALPGRIEIVSEGGWSHARVVA